MIYQVVLVLEPVLDAVDHHVQDVKVELPIILQLQAFLSKQTGQRKKVRSRQSLPSYLSWVWKVLGVRFRVKFMMELATVTV